MDRRNLGTALALAGAALLVAGVLTRGWWVGNQMWVGLRSVEKCEPEGGSCRTASLRGALGKGHDAYFGFTRATEVGAFAAAAALLLAAALRLARRSVDWPVQPTSLGILLCMGALVAACTLVALKPDPFRWSGLNPGYSFLMLGAGCTAGLLGSIWLGRAPAHDAPPGD